ncbi:hypothetical protein AIOL_004310 [Candidatus Rhodobacter oscarellae]|uniref:Uncharacterized protein n=1 Tax=Candidatus Rhodobacter oscarellae TaxID=1675527 RepID=A0A0J9H0R4_9RHOB|nr:hypothetical protein AIOL_004310 [Candidatus Rhodobacter lobularis]
MLGWSMQVGAVAVVVTLVEMSYLWFAVLPSAPDALQAAAQGIASGGFIFDRLTLLVAPILIVNSVASGVFVLLAALAAAVCGLLIPRHLIGYLDGVLWVVMASVLIPYFGIADRLSEQLGNIGGVLPYVVLWLLVYMRARLVPGFARLDFKDNAALDLAIDAEAAWGALRTHFGISIAEPGDTALLAGQTGGEVRFSIPGHHHLVIEEKGTNRNFTTSREEIAITMFAAGHCRLNLRTRIEGLNPWIWWGCWVTPSARDQALHLSAQILGEPDPSIAGRILRRHRRKAERAAMGAVPA